MHFGDGQFLACGAGHFLFCLLKKLPEFDALAVHGEQLQVVGLRLGPEQVEDFFIDVDAVEGVEFPAVGLELGKGGVTSA